MLRCIKFAPMPTDQHSSVRSQLLAALAGELEQLAPGAGARTAFEKPRQAAHGDLACTAAMQLAKPLKTNPRAIGEQLRERLLATPAFQQWVQALELAGPGFLNIRLKPEAHQQTVREVLAQGAAYGISSEPRGKVMVEFVSANPTGPLHVGHGRQAALGDAISNLLATQGWQVHREFYYNDAGVQIAKLTISVQARARGKKPGDPDWPEDAYNGDYIADIARDFLDKKTVHSDGQDITASGDVDDADAVRRFAVAYLRAEQDRDLQAFRLKFDQYYLESSLYADGRVQALVQLLTDAGQTYEQDGALWLRTSAYGDDKDRVMRKSDGTYTYFVPDVAYHLSKWERGYQHAINVQGSDHHGTVARVRAGLQAAGKGIAAGWPQYVLHTMVRVMRDGREVKITKRAGSYVTLRELIDWTSADAVRFFMLSRKPDTDYIFDVDLALQKNNDNPVYYVQYAHARICSVLRAWGGDGAALAQADLSPLASEAALALLRVLGEYPQMLATAAATLAPHDVTFYLRALASAYHSYYDAERVLVDDEPVRLARLALLAAVRQVLQGGLALLGVSAPQQM